MRKLSPSLLKKKYEESVSLGNLNYFLPLHYVHTQYRMEWPYTYVHTYVSGEGMWSESRFGSTLQPSMPCHGSGLRERSRDKIFILFPPSFPIFVLIFKVGPEIHPPWDHSPLFFQAGVSKRLSSQEHLYLHRPFLCLYSRSIDLSVSPLITSLSIHSLYPPPLFSRSETLSMIRCTWKMLQPLRVSAIRGQLHPPPMEGFFPDISFPCFVPSPSPSTELHSEWLALRPTKATIKIYCIQVMLSPSIPPFSFVLLWDSVP
jgi:hypothetical protein